LYPYPPGFGSDYIGLIIGDNLLVLSGAVITNPGARAKTYKSISSFKKPLSYGRPRIESGWEICTTSIKNVYPKKLV
jgi:hypothetical protein